MLDTTILTADEIRKLLSAIDVFGAEERVIKVENERKKKLAKEMREVLSKKYPGRTLSQKEIDVLVEKLLRQKTE